MQQNFKRLSLSFLISISVFSCQTQEKQETNSVALSAEKAINDKKEKLTTDSIKISAIELAKEYVANEVKADADFKGKIIFVSGVVTDIKKGLSENIFIVLRGSEKYREVQCYVDETTAKTLAKGMNVIFKGKCDGLMANVILLDCILVKEK